MKKILIIEDESSLRDEMVDWFTFEGFHVSHAPNGLEGLRLAKEFNPEIILCDIMMPELDGYGVLDRLREDPVCNMIPFIIMSAQSERDQIRTGMEKGADDYITKPFSRVELLNAVFTRLKKAKDVHEHAQTEAEELRHNLITTMPHEFNTPLNGILGFTQILIDDIETLGKDEILDIGKQINISAQRLYRHTQNYLLLARLEIANKHNQPPGQVTNPGEICSQICRKLAGEYGRTRDLKLSLIQGIVGMNAPEFAKAVEEVCDNAFKFSKAGQPVEVTTQSTESEFRLIIKDHGHAMNELDIRHLGAFRQFERKHYEQQGIGLGLAITQKLVQLAGGTLTIESTPSSGTAVTISIPHNQG
jgi:signal transduction histidine kinase